MQFFFFLNMYCQTRHVGTLKRGTKQDVGRLFRQNELKEQSTQHHIKSARLDTFSCIRDALLAMTTNDVLVVASRFSVTEIRGTQISIVTDEGPVDACLALLVTFIKGTRISIVAVSVDGAAL
jgi:hypothetical protein